MSKYVCLTGAAGFIGRVLARKLCERGDYVYAVDRLDYAADPYSIDRLRSDFPSHFHFRCEDVRNLGRLPDVDTVIHTAASTHVDNSLSEGEEFVANNVGSVAKLLELIRGNSQHGAPRLIHISTDEVYGPVSDNATPDSPLAPSSPYAASKAAADMLVHAWGKTYGLPYTIIRPTNCYGPGQYPEKLIPKAVRCSLLGKPVPVHGDGSMTRQWLRVDDLARAVLVAVDSDSPPAVINVGGNTHASVRDVVERVIGICGGSYETGYHRPAVDTRYAVDDSPLRAMGWRPEGDFWKDLPLLVEAERQSFRW